AVLRGLRDAPPAPPASSVCSAVPCPGCSRDKAAATVLRHCFLPGFPILSLYRRAHPARSNEPASRCDSRAAPALPARDPHFAKCLKLLPPATLHPGRARSAISSRLPPAEYFLRAVPPATVVPTRPAVLTNRRWALAADCARSDRPTCWRSSPAL